MRLTVLTLLCTLLTTPALAQELVSSNTGSLRLNTEACAENEAAMATTQQRIEELLPKMLQFIRLSDHDICLEFKTADWIDSGEGHFRAIAKEHTCLSVARVETSCLEALEE